MLHAYRLTYPDSPQAPEMLWEWAKAHVGRLRWNATVCGRERAHRSLLTREALAQEHQRLWETSYRPRPAYAPWDAWQAWMREYREVGRDVQDIAEEHHGRLRNDPRPVRQDMRERDPSRP